MPKVALFNVDGQQVGEIELSDAVFGIEPNTHVLHQAVVLQLANRRLGTHSTKTRAEVAGGGKKPWRQKGTGRARAGSIRSPLWRKGGVTFGPKPRKYTLTLPKKVRRLALVSALSAKAKANEIIVVTELPFAEPKTQQMVKVLRNLNAAKKALIVTADQNDMVVKSARNIPGVKALRADTINVYDLLHHDSLVITKDAVAKVEEALA